MAGESKGRREEGEGRGREEYVTRREGGRGSKEGSVCKCVIKVKHT